MIILTGMLVFMYAFITYDIVCKLCKYKGERILKENRAKQDIQESIKDRHLIESIAVPDVKISIPANNRFSHFLEE